MNLTEFTEFGIINEETNLNTMASNSPTNRVNHSIHNVSGTKFVIQPEYLNNDEIKYELRLRGLSVQGERRGISASLRDVLIMETLNQGKPLNPFNFTCAPAEEFRYMRANFENLKSRLENVNRSAESQNNFMTLWLHMSGRMGNLVSRVTNSEQQTALRYLSDLDQLTIMFDQYKTRQASNRDNLTSADSK